jgi:hypothetical protein
MSQRPEGKNLQQVLTKSVEQITAGSKSSLKIWQLSGECRFKGLCLKLCQVQTSKRHLLLHGSQSILDPHLAIAEPLPIRGVRAGCRPAPGPAALLVESLRSRGAESRVVELHSRHLLACSSRRRCRLPLLVDDDLRRHDCWCW